MKVSFNFVAFRNRLLNPVNENPVNPYMCHLSSLEVVLLLGAAVSPSGGSCVAI